MDKPSRECEKIIVLLSDYAEGILTEKEHCHVERHLDACELCRSQAVLTSGVVKALSKIPEQDPPSDFAAGLAARVRKERYSPIAVLKRIPENMLAARVMLPVLGLACLLAAMVFRPSGFSGFIAHKSTPTSLAEAERSGSFMSDRPEDGLVMISGSVVVNGTLVEKPGVHKEFEAGDCLRVPKGRAVCLRFADASRAVASNQAIVTVQARRLELDAGRLDLEITPNGLGFLIVTPQAEVVVRGTKYSVSVDDATTVEVSRGMVSVTSRKTRESVLVRGGGRASVSSSGIISCETMSDRPGSSVSQADCPEDTRLDASGR